MALSPDFTFSGPNVINGRVTCARGQGPPDYSASGWSYSQAIPSGAMDISLSRYANMYIYHGGASGYGPWEH